ncbi:hypothetical protein LMG31506_04352 [Cupriavidus yeoncheonensis]|uniref:Transposase n=1 Tax=Cupriavidus yeoncheonensis TaxID=1462994 RepID=A0A916MZA9_9BURK|nr:hypothetical protein LMG31506_04352 [Cupriavidus yeoncheonensis]
MQLLFVPTESTPAYFTATRAYVERHGKPLTFYSDKAGIFRVNARENAEGRGYTQFGRALFELNIGVRRPHRAVTDHPRPPGRS